MPLKKRNIVVISIIIAILIFVVIIRIVTSGSDKRPQAVPIVVPRNAIRTDIEKSETLTGNILPIQQANIYPKVNGNIENINVDIGSYVTAGQILALIDTTIYSQNMKQAKANFMQAKANYENSKTNYERNKTLFEQNLISKQDLDNAETSMQVTESQKEAADANYINALTQLSYCKIVAPFNGYITKRAFDPGAYITAGSSESSNLFTIMNVDKLKSIVNVPEKIVPLLNGIKGIEIHADALPDSVIFSGELKRISEAVDLNTRTMAVEVDIENTGHHSNNNKELKPGMFASVKLILERKKNVLTLPDNVILNDDKGDYIYILNADSTVNKKYIKLGIQQNNKNEILSGIDEKDKIVFEGQNLINDKMKVRVAK